MKMNPEIEEIMQEICDKASVIADMPQPQGETIDVLRIQVAAVMIYQLRQGFGVDD